VKTPQGTAWTRSRLARYGIAASVSALALLLSPLLGPLIEPSDFPFFLGAVMFSAWYGGLGPGLLATTLGALAGTLLVSPASSSTDAGLNMMGRLGVFVIEALVISSLSSALRTTRQRAEALFASEQAARTEVEATAERLRHLQAVTDTALAHLRLDDLLRELIGRIRDALAADTVVILLLTEDESELAVRAAYGLEEEVAQGIRIPMGRGIAGRIATRSEPMLLEDLSRVEIASPVLREKGLRTLLGAPLMVEGRLIGVVHVGTLRPRTFSEDEARLLRLVGDLVVYVRSGADSAARRAVDAGLLIDSVWTRLVESGIASQVQLIRPADQVLLWADPVALERVFENLLGNAVIHSSTEKLPKVEITWQRQPGSVQIEVRDTGIGIEPEDRPHICELFFRGRNVTAAGSGIGLAIVKRIVDTSGARIADGPNPGGGSVFTLTWPTSPVSVTTP